MTQAVRRIGLVGFGRLAQGYYLPALRRLASSPALAIADPGPHARAAATKLAPRATFYEDYRELLERESIDALLVASPPSTHLAIWRAACDFALPVFMEKPFPMSSELPQLDPRDPAWSRLMVDFNRRFWPPYQQLAALVREERCGRVRAARFCLRVNAQRWATVTDHRAWPGEGGALHDLGTQVLDLAMMILGAAPQRVRIESIAAQDHLAELHFENGAMARCEFGYASRNEESVHVECERGVLSLLDPNFAVHCAEHAADAGVARRTKDLAMLGYRGLVRSRSMLRASIASALDAFFDAIATGSAFRPGFDDALRVTQWIAAAR
jgi:predicted dehydrogenase